MPIFAFGSNIMGQLSQPDELICTDKPIELTEFRNKKVLKMACGKMHTIILCENNEIYSWGVNDDYALGREGVEDEGIKLIEVPTKNKITDICAGASFSAFLTEKGHVYTCGTFKSTNGIFGYNLTSKFGIGFAKIENLKGIVKISAGANHILMLDKNGAIWSVGANESYQLGRKHRLRREKYILIPMIISSNRSKEINYNFKEIEGGAFHSFAINTSNETFSWGSNCNGQLGNGSLQPTDLKSKLPLENIDQIACGMNHTLIKTGDKKLYGCGENTQYQLGLQNVQIVAEPTFLLCGVEKVRAGGDFTVIQIANRLYSCGLNVESECGFSKKNEEIKSFTEIKHKFNKIVDFQCGGNFTLVQTEK
ncbi:hypothetical protein NUSPORA_02268 [Nucleospora cyclopteri]